MGTTCLSVCPECNRHVRCGERACPFCGAKVASFMRVLEYRLMTRFDRSRALSLGAALTAAGFATNCSESVAVYGAPCNPPYCFSPAAGAAGVGGDAGSPQLGGSGGATGGEAGAPSDGGTASEGGTSSEGGAGGVAATPEGGAGGENGLGGEGGLAGGAGAGG